MTMYEAERLNQVLMDLHNQYLFGFQAREGARLEVLQEAKDVASWAHEAWAARRLNEAVGGYCEALLILRQV